MRRNALPQAAMVLCVFAIWPGSFSAFAEEPLLPTPGDDANVPDLPSVELSEGEGETPESIRIETQILGEKESQRRDWIALAFELRNDKSKKLEEKLPLMYDYLRAADRIRSSTFTRCNLGLIADKMGDSLGAAEHFRSEMRTELPMFPGERLRLVRHVCEASAHLAFVKVGELNIDAPKASKIWVNKHFEGEAPLLGGVFVKPNEDYKIRVQFPDDGGEFVETIQVKPGETSRLTVPAPKPKANMQTEEARPFAPLAPRGEFFQPASGGEAGWRKSWLGASGALLGAGLVTWLGAAVAEAVINRSLGKLENENRCESNSLTSAPCKELFSLKSDKAVANAVGITGGIIASLGGVGLGVYVFTEPPTPRATAKPISFVPRGLEIQGSF